MRYRLLGSFAVLRDDGTPISIPAADSWSRVKSSAASAMPRPIAATAGRVMLNVFITPRKPPELSFGIDSSPPSRFSRGTRQSVKR